MNNSGSTSYYYYNSPTPISSFSPGGWKFSSIDPKEKFEEDFKEEPEQGVDMNEVSDAMQGEMEDDPDVSEVDGTESQEGSESGESSDSGGDSGGGDGGGD